MGTKITEGRATRKVDVTGFVEIKSGRATAEGDLLYVR